MAIFTFFAFYSPFQRPHEVRQSTLHPAQQDTKEKRIIVGSVIVCVLYKHVLFYQFNLKIGIDWRTVIKSMSILKKLLLSVNMSISFKGSTASRLCTYTVVKSAGI